MTSPYLAMQPRTEEQAAADIAAADALMARRGLAFQLARFREKRAATRCPALASNYDRMIAAMSAAVERLAAGQGAA